MRRDELIVGLRIVVVTERERNTEPGDDDGDQAQTDVLPDVKLATEREDEHQPNEYRSEHGPGRKARMPGDACADVHG